MIPKNKYVNHFNVYNFNYKKIGYNEKEGGDMNKELILIVDDIPGNLKLLGRILKKKNYSISIADNAKKALKFIDKRKPDLILLDIMMPEMNGFELCTNLKNNKNKKDIPIIFISALDDTKSKVKGFELGGVDYITKPFIKQEVLVRIKTHLNMSKAKKKIDLLYSNLDKKIKNAKRLIVNFYQINYLKLKI